MLKKLLLLLFIPLCVVMAQPEDDDYEPIERAPAFDAPFGGGGGYMGGVAFMDFAAINKALAGFGTPDIAQAFYTSSGGGFIYIGFIKHLRLGGIGFTSGTSSKGTVNGFNKETRYSNSFAGLTVEYSLPFIRDWALSVGGIIGVGGQELELYKHNGSVDWNGDLTTMKDDLLGSTRSYGRKYSNTYMVLAPTLNADFLLHPLISVRVGAGYSFTMFGDNWKADNGVAVTNFPASDLKGNGFFLQLGIMAGLFFY